MSEWKNQDFSQLTVLELRKVAKAMGVQLGALTPVFFAFRDREHVLNQIEANQPAVILTVTTPVSQAAITSVSNKSLPLVRLPLISQV